MTTPTQAQIEAAKKARKTWWKTLVLKGDPRHMRDTDPGNAFETGYLTAAAQVGELRNYTRNEVGQAIVDAVNADRTATIERCAQAVKDCEKGTGRNLSDVIIAIRKLKDEPHEK